MIVTWLLQLIGGTIQGLLSVLPAFTISLPGLTSGASTIGGYAGLAGGYFPVSTLGLCLAAVFAVKVGAMAIRVVLFVYHQFWGSS